MYNPGGVRVGWGISGSMGQYCALVNEKQSYKASSKNTVQDTDELFRCGLKCDSIFFFPLFYSSKCLITFLACTSSLGSASNGAIPAQRAVQVQNPPKFYIADLLTREMVSKS